MPKATPPELRFWKFVNKSGPVPPHLPELGVCWVWTGTHASNFGYGRIYARNTAIKAHRLSYEIAHGPLKPGVCVLHRCDNPLCVRPEHLFVGSKADNCRDRAAKGRTAVGLQHGQYMSPERMPRGESHGMHKLTAEQVREIRARYKPFVTTRKMLAHEYGMSRSMINMILGGKNWRHIV